MFGPRFRSRCECVLFENWAEIMVHHGFIHDHLTNERRTARIGEFVHHEDSILNGFSSKTGLSQQTTSARRCGALLVGWLVSVGVKSTI